MFVARKDPTPVKVSLHRFVVVTFLAQRNANSVSEGSITQRSQREEEITNSIT
jgi:hypothetical protein